MGDNKCIDTITCRINQSPMELFLKLCLKLRNVDFGKVLPILKVFVPVFHILSVKLEY